MWEPGWPTKLAALSTVVSAGLATMDPSLVPTVEVIGAGTIIIWLVENMTYGPH